MNVEMQKIARVCRAVERVTQSYLGEKINDEIMDKVVLLGVSPGNSRAQLIITVGLDPSRWLEDFGRVMEILRAMEPGLRSEVARAVNRKRVPNLQFEVRPFGSISKTVTNGEDNAN